MTKAAQEQFQAEEQRLMRQLKETEKKLIALQGRAGRRAAGRCGGSDPIDAGARSRG